MKTYPPPHVLTMLLLFASTGLHAVNTCAQATAPMAPPTRNLAHALSPRARAKRIALLRTSKTSGGTRVTVTSDSALSDYSAFRQGEVFYVRIPHTKVSGAQHPVSGQGFTEMRIAPLDDDLLLSFRVEADTAVRVNQTFNRLDIVFTPKESFSAAPPSVTAAPMRVASVAAVAKESQPPTQTGSFRAEGQESERVRQLLKRVEELEARVRLLEAKQPVAAENPNGAAALLEHAATPTPSGRHAAEIPPTATSPSVVEQSSTHGGPADDANSSGDHARGLPTGTPRMQIQGYADVSLRASNEKGRTTSFTLGQLDLFITSRLSQNFSVLGELILEAEEDNSFSFRAHRLFLRYAPRDYFSLRIGRDHTAIGYYNTTYHHGSWFETAANRPYIFAFENKGGILPLHNVGISVSGRIPSAPFGLRYVAEIGNGRPINTTRDRSVAIAVDENNGKAFNLALIARPSRPRGFQTGFSLYRDQRTPTGASNVGETIMAAHLVYRSSRNELLNEGVLVRHATGARVFYTPAFYTQFSRRFGDARPYFRYQYVNAPEGDPIFQTLEVGRRDGPSVGLRYDVSEFAALKMQYDRTFRRRKSALDELILQLAFTF